MSDDQTNMGQLLDELRLDKTAMAAKTPAKKGAALLLAVSVIVATAGFYMNRLHSQETNEHSTTSSKEQLLAAKSSSASQPQNPNTVAAPPGKTKGRSQLDASGYLYAKRQATVSSQSTGRLIKIHVEEGNNIKEGQLIAELDARLLQAQLALAQSQLTSKQHLAKQTRVLLEEAKSKFERAAQIARKKLNTIEQYETARFSVLSLEARLARDRNEIEISRRQIAIQQEMLNNSKVYAPFSGVVIEQSAQIGEIVSPISAGGGFTRTGICTLVDLSSLEGEVHVNERFIERVYPGQTVTLSAHAYPDVKVSGKVTVIMPSVNKETAAIKVKISLSEHDARLLPNMGIDVTFSEKSATYAQNAEAVAHQG